MSKNLTRKGLAFGAVVALGTTLFAGAPAQAASVLFAPTTGTGNTLVAGETFSLTASLSSDLPASNSTQLKFKVANTTGVAATVTVNGKTLLAAAASAAHGAGASVVALDASVGGATAASALASSTTSAVYGLGSDVIAETSAIVATASAATNPTTIAIASTAATTASYTVTAFLDANNNAVIDNGELSAVQTVNFVKIADSGLTVALTKPVQSSTALAATATFAADINVAQLSTAKYKVGFGLYGVSGVTSATAAGNPAIASANVTSVSKNTGNTALTSAGTATSAPAAGATYSAQVWYDNVATTFVAVGTASTQVVAASAVADNSPLTVAPTISDNVINGAAGFGSVGVYSVRTGVTSTAVKTTVKLTPSGGTATAVGAGVAVKVTVSGLTLGTNSGITDTMSVAGASVTAANAATFSAIVYTAADGTVTVPVVTGYGYATTAITVILSVVDAGSAATGQVSLAWTASAAPTFSRVVVGSTDLTVVKGGTIALKYALKDSYNALYSGTDYRLVVSAAGAGTAPTAVGNYFSVVNGIGNISFADNSTGVGTNVLTITKEVLANGIWGSSTAVATVNVNVVAAAQTATAVTAVVNVGAAQGSAANLLLPIDVAGTYVSGDTLTATNTVKAPSITSGSSTTIGGVVTDASGVAVANAPVTVALAGAQISSGTVYGIGSLTVLAGDNGQYTVTVSTHTAGAQTATVTSGAATKTVKVYVDKADVASGATLTITAPATAQSGSTISYSVVLADKFGNPVSVAATGVTPTFSFSAKGVGSSSAAATATVAGSASGTTTTQIADAGTLTITATYNFDGATASAPITATASVVVSDLAKAAADKAAADAAAKAAADAAAKAAADAAAAEAAKASTVAVVAGSASVASGLTTTVTVTLKNAAGAVAAGRTVSLSSTGVGFLNAASGVSDANGQVSVKFVSNPTEAGSAVITATVDGKTASATITVAAPVVPEVAATVAAGTGKVEFTISNAKGELVQIKIGNKTVKTFTAYSNAHAFGLKAAKGSAAVKVYVAGDLVAAKTVSVK